MELGTLGIALVVVIGVPLITAGYASPGRAPAQALPERRRASYRPWLWLAPGFAFLIAYLIYPTVSTFFLSLSEPPDRARSSGSRTTRGLFGSAIFPQTLLNTGLWIVFFTAHGRGPWPDHRHPGRSGPLRAGREGA